MLSTKSLGAGRNEYPLCRVAIGLADPTLEVKAPYNSFNVPMAVRVVEPLHVVEGSLVETPVPVREDRAELLCAHQDVKDRFLLSIVPVLANVYSVGVKLSEVL